MLRRGAPGRASEWLPAVGAFAGVAAILFWLRGTLLFFSNDEGIVLEAAERMLRGQKLYVDFFGYMSPGSYWLHEGALALFGTTLLSGRLVMIFGFGLQCGLMVWLLSRLASRAVAWGTLVLFVAFESFQPGSLIPNHRWDSAALALSSIALSLQAYWSGRRRWWVAAGACLAAAIACTPSVALIGAVTAGWLGFRPDLRRSFGWYAAGGTLAAGGLFAAALLSGIWPGLLNQMHWLRVNYRQVNWMPYGSVIGGYSVHGLLDAGLNFCLATPAVVPVAALAGYLAALGARRMGLLPACPGQVPLGYLAACVAASIATTFPRSDVGHLVFVAAPAYILAAALLFWTVPPGARKVVFIVLLPWALMSLGYLVSSSMGGVRVSTPVGTLRVQPNDAEAVERLLATVKRNDRLFVQPYMPLLYFLTQAENPTRFSFLAPGMMTSLEERQALADLERQPPQWILWLPLSRAEFLRVFPNGTALDHRFRALEAWIERDYAPVSPEISVGGYSLWSRIRLPAGQPASNH